MADPKLMLQVVNEYFATVTPAQFAEDTLRAEQEALRGIAVQEPSASSEATRLVERRAKPTIDVGEWTRLQQTNLNTIAEISRGWFALFQTVSEIESQTVRMALESLAARNKELMQRLSEMVGTDPQPNKGPESSEAVEHVKRRRRHAA
jgi:hypothetical protein